jgi:hypothetical protein
MSPSRSFAIGVVIATVWLGDLAPALGTAFLSRVALKP